MDQEQEEDLRQQLAGAKADNKAFQVRMSEMSTEISKYEEGIRVAREQLNQQIAYVDRLEKIIAAHAAKKRLKKLRKEFGSE